MTTELFWLTLSALMAGSLWIPYIIGVTSEPEQDNTSTTPQDRKALRPWVQRADRAHMNMLETLMPFGLVLIIAHLAGISTTTTVWASIAFFVLRVAHAAWMLSGMTVVPTRPIIFTASWLCTIVVGVTVLIS